MAGRRLAHLRLIPRLLSRLLFFFSALSVQVIDQEIYDFTSLSFGRRTELLERCCYFLYSAAS